MIGIRERTNYTKNYKKRKKLRSAAGLFCVFVIIA